MKSVLLALLFLSTISNAKLGGVDGGGGKSIVCRNAAGEITSAEVLDLYEGRIMFGLNIEETSEPMDFQILRALSRIPKTTRKQVELHTYNVQKHMRLTPPGTELLPIDDSFEVIAPKDCIVEQAANYYNNKLILINIDIWEKLSETGKAALILHEAIYATNRIAGATNSRQSRHAVAHIFDPATQWTDVNDGLPHNRLTCVSMNGGSVMYAYQNKDNQWTLQFQILGKSFVMSKKTLTIMNPDLDLNEAKNFPIKSGDDLIGVTDRFYGNARSAFEDGDSVTITKKWEALKDDEGKIIRGYQTPRYYIEWISATFPNTSTAQGLLNCSIVIP